MPETLPAPLALCSAVDAANTMANDVFISGIDPLLVAKVPVQERGKVRFNAIVAATEELVMELGIDQVSVHKVAKKAQVPAASVYQYFPSMGAIFGVVAEKHFMPAFDITQELLDNTSIRSWQDLTEIVVDGAYEFYSRDKMCEVLFLSKFISPGVEDYAVSRLMRIIAWYMDNFSVLYKKSDLAPLPEKLSLCIQIVETIFRRSFIIHGEITDLYRQECKIIVNSYLRGFFEEIER